ncbi:acyl-ACP--UDP-N-acetylglucosamine O-acyltransferase [Candidatus Venteria ishoeyi]|uniref:Acyl-[acyl-carrier-protein]--UDP-N-acetylglucosamine O-acyltransferase n=1 Tax=Candidatus Venteria ishoeyi TaxID=1899563 RepID=A0A1H6F747_9GAMM|nr:acyl-ACP--UDP-N-acetylglucosamine O-acyltransferase [Candidatus Venteria ishoeyi]MDM8547991.1 acyl-ACP--UDP-N-acetylglucosamine O-acyltransferase [Candidatus Venteria ishoeyi]SEH05948.1 Acyl-[acyl-carrier-protein]--UDP-N-acetylglucosamine O-acyltransferase [Candidatus Venteria ishoeyi]
MIDPRAIIDPTAELDSSVEVGPFSVIGAGVQIDAGTWIGSHAVIKGPTRIGKNNRIYQFTSLGEIPQDKKYANEETRLEIGDGNEIREFCTMSRGTEQGGGITRIGDDNWIMSYTHFAHDCQVGNHTIFANNASLAGHAIVEDHVILGGFSGVHQFCALGAHSFIAAGAIVLKDVPPFVMAAGGDGATANGLNREGMKRRGFSPETMALLRKAYKILYRQNLTLKAALLELEKLREESKEVGQMIDFIQKSSRGIVR